MDKLLNTAITAAQLAGAHIAAAASQIDSLEIEQKSRFDYVSRVDRESELLIKEHISSQYPEHEFMGEEFGVSGNANSSDYCWIVDPLDGTTNFLRGIPHYAVSIAVTHQGQLQHGVVYDPAKDELFYASQGQGCFVNNVVVTPLQRNTFAGALLSTGVPFSGKNLDEVNAFTATMEDLLAKGTSGIRRLGAAALDLAYVAAGRYDGFWEAYLKPWDIAAGALLVQEAGGRVGDFSGGNGFLQSGDIVAGPTVVFDEITAVVGGRYSR